MAHRVHSFSKGCSDGGAGQKSLFGEKGASLCEMASLGLPVPPGFVIPTSNCEVYASFPAEQSEPPAALRMSVSKALADLEQCMGQRFGDSDSPLLVSVRTSAAVSVPGIMGTVLNLGLNDAIVESYAAKGDKHFACDLYRRFIANYASIVKQLDLEPFEREMTQAKRRLDAKCMLGRKHEDGDLPVEDLEELITKYKSFYEEQVGEKFPQDPELQLWEAIAMGFSSWYNPRAKKYCARNDITNLQGTAVVVQAMVFGNHEEQSGTGSAFLGDPTTGEPQLSGEWLQNAQGQDYLKGARAPRPLLAEVSREWAQREGVGELERALQYPAFEESMPRAFAELQRVQNLLMLHFENMEFIEFTVQHGFVWLLQTHISSRQARATVQAAVDAVTPAPRSRKPMEAKAPGASVLAALEGLPAAKSWVEEFISLVQPLGLHLCDGTRAEYDALAAMMVEKGTFQLLNPEKRPDSYLCRSDPGDVARVEECTFICCEREEDAGPTNNWYAPSAMKAELRGLFRGSMRGRTMYIIPYCMGPIDSPLSKIGMQLTDSVYAVLNMHIMARVGKQVLDRIAAGADFVPGVHSVGYPLVLPSGSQREDKVWPCNLENRYIAHFPETREIWSFGSGYGGNALLGKKCFALRIASAMGRDQGWMAEHMLILKLTSPEGVARFVTAAFPSACGKTNLAMLQPSLPGWKVECVGDDIAWMHFGEDGRLYAINPEAGFFGVAPGTNDKSNFNAMRSFDQRAIFTNVALTDDNDVWWEGMTDDLPEHLIDWKGNSWTPASGTPAAHANSRFTCPAGQCPTIAPEFEAAGGVPIDAILFGGRRDDTQPLVVESRDWCHGTFLGAIMASKKTAAAAGKVGELRFDPMAILPFCGYNMADYWGHWLKMGAKGGDKMPKIFYVNWFNKGTNGKFIWPGFGENIRVLKWISDRCAGSVGARETPIGNLPHLEDLDCEGLGLTEQQQAQLLTVKREEWEAFLPEVERHLAKFGDTLPPAIRSQFETLKGGITDMAEADARPAAKLPPPEPAPRCVLCKGWGFVRAESDDASGPYAGMEECSRCA